MFDKLKNIFGRKEIQEIVEWETNDSIFNFVKTKLNNEGIIIESAETLPDEVKKHYEIKFPAGFIDSMFGADESENSKSRIKTLVKKIKNVAKKMVTIFILKIELNLADYWGVIKNHLNVK